MFIKCTTALLQSLQRFYINFKVFIQSFMCCFCKANNITFTRIKALNFVYAVKNTKTKLKVFVCVCHINREASEIVYLTETGQGFRKPNFCEC